MNASVRIISAGLLFTISIGTMLAQGKQPPTKAVTVDNTSANPVPVTGTISLSNSGNPISITGNVSVANPIQIGNAATNPVAVQRADNPAFQPYDHFAATNFTDGVKNGDVFWDVPAGKRLVVEFITIDALLPTGQIPYEVQINNHRLITSFQASHEGLDYYATCAPLRLYVESGTGALHLTINRTGTTGSGGFSAGITGYLVDVPSNSN